MQHRPKFNGVYIAVLLALALLAFNLWTTFSTASSGVSMPYSKVVDYFEANQVVGFEMDLNTGNLRLALKEGEVPLPEGVKEAAAEQQQTLNSTQGLLSAMMGSQQTTQDILPSGEGIYHITYRLPYPGMFVNYVQDYIDQYNEANPSSPMVYDYIAARAEVPWFDILLMVMLVGSMVFVFYTMYRGSQGGGIMNVGRAKVKDQTEDKRKTTFADVAGADEEKNELEEIVQFLKNPSQFNSLGARIPHGVLLVGPPGTGKTLLARACAGEAGVPFYSISGSDFVEMYVGVGASRVRDLFDKAKKTAPSIIFIDEIDAVGRHRGAGLGGGHDEREQTLNQLLVEMDGFSNNEGIIVIAATNRRDILDPALLRPGRFDRQIVVSYPDVKGREEILKVHSRNKPLGFDVDLSVIAKTTAGFTGADLENLMNEAALLAARKGRKAITLRDIEEATIKVVAGPEKRSRVISDKEKKLTAYHEAGHAITTYYSDTQDPVHEISIIPRGMAGGYTLSLPEHDKSFMAKKEMEEQIVTLLGGRVAEALILDDISTGASNDIERATKMARSMVTRYGFSEKLGPVVYGQDEGEVFLGRDFNNTRNYSEEVAAEIDSEIRRIVEEGYETARQLLTAHQDQLHLVAQYLIQHEKVDEATFGKLMKGELDASGNPTLSVNPDSYSVDSADEQNPV